MEEGASSEAAVAVPAAETAEAAETAALSEEARGENEDEALLTRAQKMISKIVASQANPNPRLLHTLATMLEAQESRYVQESESSSFNSARASHSMGRLYNLVRENDEFYEAISSKFLSESTYSVTVHSAAARILLSCSLAWMYPHVFDDDAVLDNIKIWVMEDPVISGDECNWSQELGSNKPTDSEMLRTYATGLLAISLTGGGQGQVVEDILTSGLSAKLMHYLCIRVLGEASSSQRDASFPTEARPTKSREENRGRSRQVIDTSRLDGPWIADEASLGDASADRNIAIRQAHGEVCWADGGESLKSELTDSSSEVVGTCDMVEEDVNLYCDGCHKRSLLDGRSTFGDRHVADKSSRDEDADENVRDDSSKQRFNREWSRTIGKGMSNEGTLEVESIVSSPSSGIQSGGIVRGSCDRNMAKNEEIKKVVDMKENASGIDRDAFVVGEDNDDRFRECNVGSRDISEMVKKAIRAAEAEARAAYAPAEAIKAAGDAAAELVKTAALEVWKNTSDEEAAVLAASEAASTVVDAAIATEVLRSCGKVDEDLMDAKAVVPKEDEELEDFIILDGESLAQLREKYCIQCLEILGEYVEALGPILHEKGVDVCLALLQRNFKEEAPDHLALLPEVLKLICALAAHRKFAALFVDRGGIQILLSVRRVSQNFFGLSSCLFTIGTLQGVMERVCALPSDVVNQMVELALQLLECSVDQARKNAAIFFASAFVFRAVLDSFDTQEGLQKMLNLLHGAASIRSGMNSGTLGMPNVNIRNDRSPAEVLTTSEKQIAYHTCVALRQFFRAHFLLLVDSLRPNKSSRGVARSNPSARAAYKPLDISNEAMDSVFLQIQRDRKLGPAFVRARWPVVDKFLASNGHITMLELCQAPPVERYLHDLAQYALGVLHVVTFVPYSRKLIVNATLSNDRVGMAAILDAASGAGYVDPEVIQPALNVLVNLVCPPPSISNKPLVPAQGQQSASVQTLNGPSENRERHSERYVSDRSVPSTVQNESRECNGESNLAERSAAAPSTLQGNSSQTAVSSGVVGDRRISLGPGAGCAGLAAQLEQGYHQAREAVRANNGIKVLLHLLHPRMITPPASLDCIRALACRVLLGLARDETIAHILTKLQVGKKLSELIRDSGSQASGTEQGRWQTELAQVAIELIAIVTNSGRASSLAATDAAAPTLRRIERAAIAAATPITYHSRELLLLIHEHLQACGLTATAALLQKEADLTPLPSLGVLTPPLHQTSVQETSNVQLQWPSGRAPCGFLSEIVRMVPREEDSGLKSDSAMPSLKKKSLAFSSSFSQGKGQPPSHSSITNKTSHALRSPTPNGRAEAPSGSVLKSGTDAEPPFKTPILLPMKRKLMELKELSPSSPAKRLGTTEIALQSPVSQTPNSGRRICLPTNVTGLSPGTSCTPRVPFSRTTLNSGLGDISDDFQYQSTSGVPTTPMSHLGLPADPQSGNVERMTLDSLVVQYLKHQHRQCPAPITTLPPLSLLHPHVCPEPSRDLNAPANVTARVSTRDFRKHYGGIHANRRDRQFIYSRFKPCRTCRDDTALLTCITFLGDSSRIAIGCHSSELKIFDAINGNVLDSQACHQTPVTLVQSALSGGSQLVLSSGLYDVRLWDATNISGGALHSFEGCKAARFSNSGTIFAALSSDMSRREVLLYDVQTGNRELSLPDSSNSHTAPVRGHAQSLIHFSPSDTMLLWNGVLWDKRSAVAVHRFDQFTDYGGGGFHPAGNEVNCSVGCNRYDGVECDFGIGATPYMEEFGYEAIINSEVWDLRKFKLLRSVPALDQTVITFNGGGDVIYAILRRNPEDIMSAVLTRRVRHPLFSAFRTIDAVSYSDIATVQVDRCVLDFATDPTDSFVGVLTMDDHDEMHSSARLFEVGRKRPTDDDSDPDDGVDTEEEDNDESEADVEPILGADLDGDDVTDSDGMSNDEDDIDSGDEDRDFNYDDIDDLDLEGGHGLLEIMAEGDEGDEDDSEVLESLSSGEEDFAADAFGF